MTMFNKLEKRSFVVVCMSAAVFSSSLLINLALGHYSGYFRILLIMVINLWTLSILSKIRGKYPKKKLIDHGLLTILLCIGAMFISSSLFGEAPLIATIYSAIPYISFYCVSYLLLVISHDRQLFKRLLVFLIILCILLSLGVFYDSTIGLINTPILGQKFASILNDISTVDATGSRRGAFFFGSATSVFPFLATGTLSCILLKRKFDTRKGELLILGSIFVIWLGCFFSFSRAPIVLGTIFSFYAFFEVYFIADKKRLFKLSNQKIVSSIILVIIICFLSVNYAEKLAESAGEYQIQRLSETLSVNDRGNSHRFVVWSEGLQQFEKPEAWLGKGLGESNLRMKKQYGYQGQPQYESSLLFTFAEGGILGLLARLVPMLVVFLATRSTKLALTSYMWILMIFCNLFASPLINGHAVQFAYFLGMSLLVSMSSDEFEKAKSIQGRRISLSS